MLDKKKHGTHLTIKSQKVGSGHVRHILWGSECHPCRARIFGNPGVHFISRFALKRVYVCASQWAYKKAPGDKAATQAEKAKQNCAFGRKTIPTCCWGREQLLNARQQKAYLTNDFVRPWENKEMSAGMKQMTQMFYPDLSSKSGHPSFLGDSAWPLVI